MFFGSRNECVKCIYRDVVYEENVCDNMQMRVLRKTTATFIRLCLTAALFRIEPCKCDIQFQYVANKKKKEI